MPGPGSALRRRRPGDSGVGSGLLNATSQVGGALGRAILSPRSPPAVQPVRPRPLPVAVLPPASYERLRKVDRRSRPPTTRMG